MQRAIIIIYMAVSWAHLLMLNDALEKSEKDIESLEAVLDYHYESLKNHRETLLLIIEELKNKYI